MVTGAAGTHREPPGRNSHPYGCGQPRGTRPHGPARTGGPGAVQGCVPRRVAVLCRAVGARLCLASLVGTHPRPRRRPGAEAHAASTILCRLRRARSQVKFLSGVSTLQSGSADRFIPAYLERLCSYLLRAGEGLRGISSPSSWERLVPQSAGSSAARKPPSAFHLELVTSLRRVPQRGESQPKLSQR